MFKKARPLKEYEIWSGGWSAQELEGSVAGPTFHGKCLGVNFKDACVNFCEESDSFFSNFNSDRMTYWGCRLFASEKSARIWTMWAFKTVTLV